MLCTRKVTLAIILTLLGAVISITSAISCPVSTCSATDPTVPRNWLNTSTHSVSLQGLLLVAYPVLPTGGISLQEKVSFQITTIREQLAPASGACNNVSSATSDTSQVLSQLNLAELCCDSLIVTDVVNVNVSRTSLILAVTDPSNIGFVLQYRLSTANGPYSVSVEDTTFTYGSNLNTTFSTNLRLDLEISNWKWAAQNATLNPSGLTPYLKIFSNVKQTASDSGFDVRVSSNPVNFGYDFRTTYSYMNMSFPSYYTADGVAHMPNSPYKATSAIDWAANPGSTLTFSQTMTTCQGVSALASPYWSNFSQTIIFSGFGYLPTCQSTSQPSTEFICYNGTWVAPTSVSAPTLVIPAGATTTIVNGNVSSTTLVFQGLGSTLTVYGCANNLTSITIELSPEELSLIETQKLSQSLLNLTGSNGSCSDLSSITITAKLRKSNCKDVKAQQTTSEGQLSAVFSISSSRCRTWWIILVSVLCGLVLIAVIVFVIVVMCVPSAKEFIRPFSKRKHTRVTQYE